MDIVRAIDKALLMPATEIGGASAGRDQAVSLLADALPLLFVAVAVVLFLSGRTKTVRERNQDVVIVALACVAIALGARLLLGEAFSRPRPFVSYPEIHHVNLVKIGSFSFPSTHALMMFAFAGVVYFIGRHRPLGIALLVLAVIVAVSRVVAGVHYPSDVLGGAVLGLGLAKLLSWQSKWVTKQMR